MLFASRKKMLRTTEKWSSTVGFILATSGAAVGLGNIWMFPYVTGMNGGGAFVLVYLLCILLIGIPIMMAEALIGRYALRNPMDAMQIIAEDSKRSPKWKYVGVWGGIALLFILSFYSVVSGWSIGYLVKTAMGAFNGVSESVVSETWTAFLANPWELLLLHTVFMILTMGVVALGVEKGLERASKIMMPGLIVILFMLVAYGAVKGEFARSVAFLFRPDFSQLTAQSVLTAMGLSFFTLALGAGCIVAYAAYLPEDIAVSSNIFKIVALDALIAILAGLAIFPLVFAYGLVPEAGPGLMFEVLPMAFSQMAGGQVIGSLFFLLLLFAAWTASISLAEPLAAMICEKLHFNRVQAVTMIGMVAWVMGIFVLLSFNRFQEVKLFGTYTFFDIAVDIPNKIILPSGGFLFAVFAGFYVDKAIAQRALRLDSPLGFKLWRFVVRYIAPIAIAVVLVSQF